MAGSVVCGMQWGDEGKGKIIDFLADKVSYVVRYQGGNNAGHTVVVSGEKFVLHLLPSGVLNSSAQCILAAGVIIDPAILLKEIEALESRGMTTKHLFISDRAHLIMPYHVRLDELKEDDPASLKIGTTRRGIGPCYMDKYERSGIRVADLLDRDQLHSKIKRNVAAKNLVLDRVYHSAMFDADEMCGLYDRYAMALKGRIIDANSRLNQALAKGEHVLFEGAQAAMLDIDHGNYPYVTSSSPTTSSAGVGSGVSPHHLTTRIGVFKAYATRVGEGPFTTELQNDVGEKIRAIGAEFGSTTGRPRRVGYLDLVNLRFAQELNGFTELALMKIDVLSGFDELLICVGYNLDGKEYDTVFADISKMSRAEPIYKAFKGWNEDITKVKKFNDLPATTQSYINFIEETLLCPIKTISVGPDRLQTIRR